MNEALLKRDAIDRWILGVRSEFEQLLQQYVEIPSVSMDPDRAGDIRRQAEACSASFRAYGGTAQIIETPGNPVVHAKFDVGPGCPTVTVYNHMDVQPATEPEWDSEPFEFVKDGDRYLGRGSTDDKGPALSALFAARYAREAGLPINIHFIWELEEEIGSPNFEAALRKGGASLATDSVVVSDTIWIARGKPAVPAGLRGTQGFRITLTTGATDQHSGVTGGAARNPIGELAQLLGEMYDARTGRCRIPGFYDDVIPATKAELAEFRSSGFTVAGFMKDHMFTSLRTKDPIDVMTRIWALPTFEVHGLVGGYTGPGVKTIIPPRAELKISNRLVPDQDSAKITKALIAFVKARIPDAQVFAEGRLAPYKGITTGPYAEAARQALKFGFGKFPAFVREGGSIGAIITMERLLKAPVMFIGLSLPEHGYHAPNENFDWGQASGGIRSFVKYFEQLAKMGKAGAEAARRIAGAAPSVHRVTKAGKSGLAKSPAKPSRKKSVTQRGAKTRKN